MADTNFVQKFDSTVSGWLSYVDQNEYVTAALSLFLILYAAYAAPKLPPYILMLFDQPLFKLLIFFLIIYTARKNPTVAIIAAIGFMVTMQALTSYKVNQATVAIMQQKRESMESLSQHQEMPLSPVLDMQMESNSLPRAPVAETHDVKKGQPIISDSQPQRVDEQCTEKAKYRSNFYPQYVNMPQDEYSHRSSGQDIGGFDPTAQYSSM